MRRPSGAAAWRAPGRAYQAHTSWKRWARRPSLVMLGLDPSIYMATVSGALGELAPFRADTDPWDKPEDDVYWRTG